MHSSTGNLHDTLKWVFCDGTYKPTDIATLRLSWPRGPMNINIEGAAVMRIKNKANNKFNKLVFTTLSFKNPAFNNSRFKNTWVQQYLIQ